MTFLKTLFTTQNGLEFIFAPQHFNVHLEMKRSLDVVMDEFLCIVPSFIILLVCNVYWWMFGEWFCIIHIH